MKIYGIARISTKKQNIERQVRNIKERYPEAIIVKETYTGTKLEGRKEFEKVLKVAKAEDTLVFDSVSRMSRNSEEGCNLYEELFNKGINIVFLKEPHINTEVFKKAVENQIQLKLNTGNGATDNLMNTIIEALNNYTIELANEQIKIAFDQAEKEVKDLQQRTREGIETARLNNKRIGLPKGTKLTTKKEKRVVEMIIQYSKDFEGTLNDIECMKICEVAKNTYYKYKAHARDLLSTPIDKLLEDIV